MYLEQQTDARRTPLAAKALIPVLRIIMTVEGRGEELQMMLLKAVKESELIVWLY